MLSSLALSFSHWNLLGSVQWVGLSNYAQLFQDPLFYKTLRNTAVFVTLSVTLEVLIALGVGLGMTALPALLRPHAERILFLPVITPMVALVLVFGWLLDPASGLVSLALKSAGQQPIAFLQDPTWAMLTLILLRVWKEMGFSILIIWTGMKALPQELQEAATLDGASLLQRFLKVTLPLITPLLFFIAMVSLINAFQAFDSVFLLTKGGPQGSTQVLVYWIYKQAFESFQVGPASALAYILFAVIGAITVMQWQARRLWVQEES
jgi:multiple sugar transport system permease protein